MSTCGSLESRVLSPVLGADTPQQDCGILSPENGCRGSVLEQMHVFDYAPRSKTLLEKAVHWCGDRLSMIGRVERVALLAFEILANVMTLGLLLPLTFRLQDIVYKMRMDAAADLFYREVAHKIDLGEIAPPSTEPIALKSNTRAFNQIAEYAIENGILWYRRKDCAVREWKPLFFDGALTNSTPVKLSVDGANMVVIDNESRVHYRKLFIEGRGVEEISKRRFIKHIPDIVERVGKLSNIEYVVIDKAEKNNWKPKWFSFPFLNRIANIFTDKMLRVSGIISHRGKFNYGYFDLAGSFHPSSTSVTTLYELESGRHSIRLHDPWSPIWSRIRFIFPETERTVYVAESLDVSSSTLLSIGYSVDAVSQLGKLKLFTAFFDADTSGSNPFIPYAYESTAVESARKRERFMCFVPNAIKRWFPEIVKGRVFSDVVENEGWKEHSLPKDARILYNQITIIQTGVGCDARQIRIAGMDKGGRVGYFHKAINADEWSFKENAHVDTSNPLPDLALKTVSEDIFRTHQYGNGNCHLVGFGREASYHPTLKMRIGTTEYELPLHKRLGFKTFFGKTDEIYDLVLPQEMISEDNPFFHAFGRRRVVPLRIDIKRRHGREFVVLKMSGIHPRISPLVGEGVR